MIDKLKEKTLEEIRDEYVLTDHVIFKAFVEKIKMACIGQMSRDLHSNKKILSTITVSDDVAHILKYYGGEFDYSDAENKQINYIGKLTVFTDEKYPPVEVYTKISEDEVFIVKNQADPVVVSYGVEAPEVKFKAEHKLEKSINEELKKRDK